MNNPRGPSSWRAFASLYCLACCLLAMGCHRLTGTAERPLLAPADARDAIEVDPRQWAAWRGGNLHGVVEEANLPLVWDTTRNVRWRTTVPGTGKSSPVVWDDDVFLTSAVGPDNRQQLAVLCFDRRSGKLRWTQELGRAVGQSHVKNGHAAATVATDGENVFAYFGSKGLFCFDADGARRWYRPLPEHVHKWGMASSPLLYGELVIQLCDGETDSYLAAFRKTDGREVWRTERQSDGCWATPVLLAAHVGQRTRHEVIVNGTGSSDGSQGFVIAYEPTTGHELWRVRGTTDIPVPTAIVADGLVISTSGAGGPILAIRPGGSGDVTATHLQWQVPSGAPYVPTGVAYGGRLFMVSDAGVASCYSLETGSQLWKKRLGGPVSASLIAGAGRVYVLGESGEMHVLAADDEFELLSTNQLQEPCYATPAVAGGEMFVRTESHLYCITEPDEGETPAAAFDENTIPSPSDLPPRS